MEHNNGPHGQPCLNFDVLRHVCNFLTDVSDALTFSLTCSALRKGALQRRLWISPVVLSNSLSVDMFHSFISRDSAALAPYIYGLKLASFYYNVENEDVRLRAETAVRHIVALLESATRIQSLHLQIAAGDRVLTVVAKLATLRELIVLSGGYDGAKLHQFLSTLQSPLRRLRIEAAEPDDFHASFLHGSLAHLAPTLEVLELEDFPLDLSSSSVTTPFTAMRTLKTKAISFASRLDVLWWLFPGLDTLIVDHLAKRFVEDNYQAARERNREAQKTCSWSSLDHVVCEADTVYLMALECPIRRMDVTVSEGRPLLRLTETLRHTCPKQLRLSLSFDYGLRAVDELFPSDLFPSELGEKLMHLVVFADINVQTVDTRRHANLSWIQFMDRLAGSMDHLRLTHLRVVFHYKIHHVATYSNAAPLDLGPGAVDTPREADLQLIAARLFDAMPTLQHVFLTHCGRTWVWAGSYTQLHSKWSASGAWRAAGVDENIRLKRSLGMDSISRAETKAVMDREELQLSQREEDMIRPCSDSMSK
ncbi:hypothetical protein V8D89_011089 [Ganoderma adspersum]